MKARDTLSFAQHFELFKCNEVFLPHNMVLSQDRLSVVTKTKPGWVSALNRIVSRRNFSMELRNQFQAPRYT